ncbi:hypothetical protein [Geodermatophilus sp. CPCC 206100]|uniref:hypothetical protein n=1 Tax=Geodermatophilus sp. CPCC 206100 TaxID=3020054 RepID=UPI003B006D06
MWAVRRDGVLTVRPSLPLPAAACAEVEEEGARLLGFLAPGRDPALRWAPE